MRTNEAGRPSKGSHETSEVFYLRAAGPFLRLMPKRAFASRSGIETMRHLMREHLGSRAHRRVP